MLKDNNMPYKSDAQRRFFHSAGAQESGIKPSVVKEYDKESKGMKLPEHVKKFSKLKESMKKK